MSRLMVIGCGGVASVAVHKCCQNSGVFTELMIASRTKSKCDALKAQLEGKTDTVITTAQVDADKVEELEALIRSYKPDAVLNVALPYQDLTIMEACLRTGVDYIDTANYEAENTDDPQWRAIYEKRCKEKGFTAYFDYSWQWDLNDRFKEAGLTALLGSGFDPGVTSVFSAYALKHYFDEIHTIDILDCNGRIPDRHDDFYGCQKNSGPCLRADRNHLVLKPCIPHILTCASAIERRKENDADVIRGRSAVYPYGSPWFCGWSVCRSDPGTFRVHGDRASRIHYLYLGTFRCPGDDHGCLCSRSLLRRGIGDSDQYPRCAFIGRNDTGRLPDVEKGSVLQGTLYRNDLLVYRKLIWPSGSGTLSGAGIESCDQIYKDGLFPSGSLRTCDSRFRQHEELREGSYQRYDRSCDQHDRTGSADGNKAPDLRDPEPRGRCQHSPGACRLLRLCRSALCCIQHEAGAECPCDGKGEGQPERDLKELEAFLIYIHDRSFSRRSSGSRRTGGILYRVQ